MTTIAIDLGTSHTRVALFERGQPRVLTLHPTFMPAELMPPASRGAPSVVSITDDGAVWVGVEAQRQVVNKPSRTVVAPKRALGVAHGAADAPRLVAPSGLKPGHSGEHGCVEIGGNPYTATDLCGALFRAAKEAAESALGAPVAQVVAPAPALFTARQREALSAAARTVGLDVVAMPSEPLAIAVDYAMARPAGAPKERVAVLRFGGGSFDVAIVAIDGRRVEVESVRGHVGLGGTDLDGRVVDWIAERARAAAGVDLRDDAAAARRLWVVGEEAKRELSTRAVAEINLPFISFGPKGPVSVQESLTREVFDTLCADLIDQAAELARAALGEARGPVGALLFAGGATITPGVRERLGAVFGEGAVVAELEPLEAALRGSAYFAGQADGELTELHARELGSPH